METVLEGENNNIFSTRHPIVDIKEKHTQIQHNNNNAIKFIMQHYIGINKPGHVYSRLERESILREINLDQIYKIYAGK